MSDGHSRSFLFYLIIPLLLLFGVLFIIIIIIIIIHSPRTADAADFFMISEKVGPSSFVEVDMTLCFDLDVLDYSRLVCVCVCFFFIKIFL
jgi:hypothetical protein